MAGGELTDLRSGKAQQKDHAEPNIPEISEDGEEKDKPRDSPNGGKCGEGGGGGCGGGICGRGDGDTTTAAAAVFSNDNVLRFNGSPVVLLLRNGDGGPGSPSRRSFRITCFIVDDTKIP